MNKKTFESCYRSYFIINYYKLTLTIVVKPVRVPEFVTIVSLYRRLSLNTKRASSRCLLSFKRFSPCSIKSMSNVLSRRASLCFEAAVISQRLCGNSRLDRGEDCDSGKKEDRCCSSKCKFKANALCSPKNHECCTEGFMNYYLCSSFSFLLFLSASVCFLVINCFYLELHDY